MISFCALYSALSALASHDLLFEYLITPRPSPEVVEHVDAMGLQALLYSCPGSLPISVDRAAMNEMFGRCRYLRRAAHSTLAS